MKSHTSRELAEWIAFFKRRAEKDKPSPQDAAARFAAWAETQGGD